MSNGTSNGQEDGELRDTGGYVGFGRDNYLYYVPRFLKFIV